MFLTDVERNKFIEWLKAGINSDKAIIEQMKKTQLPEMLLKRNQTEMMAKIIVCKILESIELETV